jgi:hypothetical protein
MTGATQAVSASRRVIGRDRLGEANPPASACAWASLLRVAAQRLDFGEKLFRTFVAVAHRGILVRIQQIARGSIVARDRRFSLLIVHQLPGAHGQPAVQDQLVLAR